LRISLRRNELRTPSSSKKRLLRNHLRQRTKKRIYATKRNLRTHIIKWSQLRNLDPERIVTASDGTVRE